MRKIGENIRFYRNLRGLTQTALARKVQVAPAYISQIEANQRVPSLKVTRRIGNVLGIEMSVLVREADPRLQDGRLSDSEKLDLLRTLIMAIEGESRFQGEDASETASVESRDFVATELAYARGLPSGKLRNLALVGIGLGLEYRFEKSGTADELNRKLLQLEPFERTRVLTGIYSGIDFRRASLAGRAADGRAPVHDSVISERLDVLERMVAAESDRIPDRFWPLGGNRRSPAPR